MTASPETRTDSDTDADTDAATDTRTRLILAAERLFGEQGFDGVTLKQITRAAGQRNESALHYHFGSKQALVEAIFIYRVSIIDRRRVALLDALEEAGQTHDLRQALETAMRPLAEQLGSEQGVRYIRFIAQVVNDSSYDLPSAAAHSGFEGIRRVTGMIGSILGDLPPEILTMRMGSLTNLYVSALSIWAREHGPASDPAERELFVADLLDTCEGFLSAPVSERTADALKRATQARDRNRR